MLNCCKRAEGRVIRLAGEGGVGWGRGVQILGREMLGGPGREEVLFQRSLEKGVGFAKP